MLFCLCQQDTLLGLNPCMNLSRLAFASHIYLTGLGNSEERLDCWTWRASCRLCGKGTRAPKDIFCVNFGISRGTFPVCRRSWHAKCYRACTDVQFHIAESENDQGLIWKREKDKDCFVVARSGDILGVPFQCDFCWFVNLKKRLPLSTSFEDQRLLSYIRRVNLDLFWCRESSTVGDTLSNLRKGLRMSKALGLDPTPFTLGPWPVEDNQGFQIALEMIRASQEVGKNSTAYQQFDTIRKIRTAYANVFERSPENALSSITFRPPQGNPVYFSDSPLTSVLFCRFMRGLERRMGRLVFQDLALDVRVLLATLEIMEEEIRDPKANEDRKRDLIVAGAAFVALYVGALRGSEVLLSERMELCKRIMDGKNDARVCHVYFPLMGRFKMENGERNILLAFASESKNSGIQIRLWIENLVSLLIDEGKDKMMGPAICESDGTVMKLFKLNKILRGILAQVQEERQDLIPLDVDVYTKYSTFRSFRRGATTRAREMEVPDNTIEVNNRWRKFQRNKGSFPRLSMIDLYTEINQALLSRLRFSLNL